MNAVDVVGVWNKIYWKQLASHGVGAGCAMAMSGIDLALWDIRGRAVGMAAVQAARRDRNAPSQPTPGAFPWDIQEPAALLDEARPHIEAGYKAIKLRVGDTPARDLMRVARRPQGPRR